MDTFTKNGIIYESSDDSYGIIFTSKEAGNMGYQAYGENVLENRVNVANKLGKEIDDFVFSKQVHSNNFYEVKAEDKGRGVYDFESGIADVDCLYTFDPSIVLTGFFADCTPVFIVSEADNLHCIVHAGWQGTTKAIVFKTINHFKSLGIKVEDMKVIIGPSIGYESFEVEEDVINAINQLDMIKTSECYTKINDIKYKADIKKVNELQALAAGIDSKNISVSKFCTFQNEDFYSFRKNNETGRMIGCIYKK